MVELKKKIREMEHKRARRMQMMTAYPNPVEPGAVTTIRKTMSSVRLQLKRRFSAGSGQRRLKYTGCVHALILLILTMSAGICNVFLACPAAASDGTVYLMAEERRWLAQHDGRIRIGITIIPPQVLQTGTGYEGLSIDYIRLMERKLGCRFLLVPYATWNEVITAARERRIDMIFAAQQTPERLEYLLFTDPYIALPNMIVVRKDRRGGENLKDMKGWIVATSHGSAVHEYLKTEYPALALRPVPNELDGLMKVSLGEADAMVVEISRASYYIEKEGIMNLRIAGEAGLVYQLRFAVRNDWPELRAILDKGLTSLTPEERRLIYRRWIIVGEKVFFTSRVIIIILLSTAGVIALAILAFLAWTRTLRTKISERTAELRTSEERYRSLIMKVPTAIVLHDGQGNIVTTNPAAQKALGLTENHNRSMALSDSGWHFVREDGSDMPLSEYPVSIVLSSRRPLAGYVVGMNSEAQDLTTWSMVNAEPEFDGTGEITRIIVSFVDITERKRAAEELRKSEQNYRLLLDTMQEGIWVVDSNEVTTFVNPRLAELLGYHVQEMIGKTISSFVDNKGMERAEQHSKRRKRGIKEQFDFELVRKDGKRIIVKINTSPISMHDGSYAGAIATVTDITEARRIEQERLANVQFFEKMNRVNRAVQGTTDTDRMMSDVLDAVLEIFECDRAFLMYPCDPDAESWTSPMERTKPEYPGVFKMGLQIPMDSEVASGLRILLNLHKPMKVGPGNPYELPRAVSERFSIKSFMTIAVRPRTGKPWQFGIHQCSHARIWTAEDERLFVEIGRRLEDGLTGLLAYRDLRKSEERFRRLAENAQDVIYRMSLPDGKYEYISPAVTEMFGYQPEDFYESPVLIRRLIHPDWHTYFEEQWTRLLQGDMLPTYEYQIIHRNGAVRWMNQRNILIRDNGRIVAIEGIITDVTKRKRAEEEAQRLYADLEKRVDQRTADLQHKSDELRDSQAALMNLVEDLNEKTAELEAANEKLKGLDRLKSLFIASMSHELRTPLNSVIGFSSIMLNEWSGPVSREQKENLDAILRAGKHLLAIINDVIDVSKIEAGKMESASEDFDIYDVVLEAAQAVEVDTKKKGLLVNIHAGRVQMHADRRRLLQCLLNLLSNAVKYTETGSIDVTVSQADDKVRIDVVDTGVGMTDPEQKKLFSPFTRFNPPMRVIVPGTGLGLYLTQKLAREVLLGDILVRSVRGKGSTFSLIVPADVR